MIQNNSMLVDLVINKWGATKQDNKVSAEVEVQHAATGAGKYVKYLIDKAHLAELTTLAGAARTYHNSMTLAWTDKGQRILPSALFMDYRAGIQGYRDKYRVARDKFLAEYPQLVQDARTRLGTMYDPSEYPSVDELRSAFDITVEFMPVPDAKDFRVDVAKETQDEIRAQITDTVNARVDKAVQGCWARTREVLERISKQCNDKKGRIYDSLMENAQDLVNVLGGLNITSNPEITQMEKDIRALIVPTDMIRANPLTRQRVADGADAILARMPWGS